MLRGFFLIFLLTGVAIVAVFGFRGQKSTGSPIEVFPDMVRQMKVRAQAPLGFFADGRGSRLPVAGTVPIGYEMPAANSAASPGAAACSGGDECAVRTSGSARAPIISTPARWGRTGAPGFPCR